MSFAEEFKKPRERHRIHDMVQIPEIEEPPVYFDVEKEVGEEEWKGMESEFHTQLQHLVERGQGFLPMTLTWLENFMILRDGSWELDADTIKKIQIEPNDRGYKEDKNRIFLNRAGIVAAFRMVGSHERDECLYDDLWKDAKRYMSEKGGIYFDGLALNLSIIDPERLKREIPMDELWEKLGRKCHSVLTEGHLDWACKLLMVMKIIFPDRIKEFNFTEIWPFFQEGLESYRANHDWSRFATIAAAMKVLAAKEVNMTDRGIECIMPEKTSHRETIPERPKRLSF